MELLLDICCLWVRSCEQGEKDSEMLGESTLGEIQAISHTTHTHILCIGVWGSVEEGKGSEKLGQISLRKNLLRFLQKRPQLPFTFQGDL